MRKDKQMTVGESTDQVNEKPIDIALHLLFQRRDRLLDDYQGVVISMSMDFNKDRCPELCEELQSINQEVQFVARIISLVRPQNICAKE